MAGVLDVFNNDAFSVLSLTDAINRQPFVPGRAGTVIDWAEAGVTTLDVMLEEIAGGKNETAFAGRSLLAAALAASVVYALSSGAASLPIGADLRLDGAVLALSPLVAIVAGGAGLAFQYLTLKLRGRCKRST